MGKLFDGHRLRRLREKIPSPKDVLNKPVEYVKQKVWSMIPIKRLLVGAGLLLFVVALLSGLFAAMFVKFTSAQGEAVPQFELDEAVPPPGMYGDARSSKWAKVRDDFVKQHPRCEACGSTQNLNVHHVLMFKDNHEHELDPNNLITLCRDHHFHIGHDPDGPWGPKRPNWKTPNPNVREDSKRFYLEMRK